jgi:hypothetical protein
MMPIARNRPIEPVEPATMPRPRQTVLLAAFRSLREPGQDRRVIKSDRKAQSIVVAPMLAYGRQVSASQEASAVLVPDHYPCIVT